MHQTRRVAEMMHMRNQADIMLAAVVAKLEKNGNKHKPLAFVEVCVLGVMMVGSHDHESKNETRKMCEEMGATVVCNVGVGTQYAISECYSQQVINQLKYGVVTKVLKKQWIIDMYAERKFIHPENNHARYMWNMITTVSDDDNNNNPPQRKRAKISKLY